MPGIRPLVTYDKILISHFRYLLYVLGNQKEYYFNNNYSSSPNGLLTQRP